MKVIWLFYQHLVASLDNFPSLGLKQATDMFANQITYLVELLTTQSNLKTPTSLYFIRTQTEKSGFQVHLFVSKVTIYCSCLMNLEIKSTIFPSEMCWRRSVKYPGGPCGQKMTTR